MAGASQPQASALRGGLLLGMGIIVASGIYLVGRQRLAMRRT